jgi:hypothetical protein
MNSSRPSSFRPGLLRRAGALLRRPERNRAERHQPERHQPEPDPPERGQSEREPARVDLPLGIVYGNCQADALRILLERAPSFRAVFRTEEIPAVHLIGEDTLDHVRQTVAGASLIVTQPVRDGYHGIPVGSEEILRYAADDCTLMTIPAVYYDGLYPFQVYVRDENGISPPAPKSVYHDLRSLHCAGMRWDAERSRSWLGELEPSPGGIVQVAHAAREGLIAYESDLDGRVAERFTHRRPSAMRSSRSTIPPFGAWSRSSRQSMIGWG